MTSCEAPAAVERAARESYGKLVAHLAARFRDVAAAEDALADAFTAALHAWPRDGLPANPEGWLYAAARRRLIDGARRAKTAALAAPALALLAEEEATGMDRPIPEGRLGLMFACAHPALEPGVRTALMLQTVLGLPAERIAPAFLTSPATLGQRLVRAKRKIREAGIPFAIPEPDAWGARLGAVLEAIYAAFGDGWAGDGALAAEAIWLGRVLVSLIPNDPEALGLLALMLHLDARRAARRDADGAFVPLDEQDVSLWRRALISEAEAVLHRAVAQKAPGRFQIEAAIQSAHAARAWRGVVDWAAVSALYEALERLTGSPVVALNRAAALARHSGPEAGLAAMAPLVQTLGEYQPYWALRAHLLAQSGAHGQARHAYGEAIARESDPAVRRFLEKKRSALRGDVEG